jgi:hypothetical protein
MHPLRPLKKGTDADSCVSKFLYSISTLSVSASHLETCFPAMYFPFLQNFVHLSTTLYYKWKLQFLFFSHFHNKITEFVHVLYGQPSYTVEKNLWTIGLYTYFQDANYMMSSYWSVTFIFRMLRIGHFLCRLTQS